MLASIKTFAYAAVVSMLLLSCNDTTGLNSSNVDDNNDAATKAGELKPPPNNSAVVIISDDVQKWMEQQLASKNDEKKLIMISDMYLPDIESSVGLSATINSEGKAEYFLNGNKISYEEYHSKWEYERQRANFNKRNLSIPGEIISDEDSRSWTVLITAAELAELSKKYDKLAIEFYIEPVNE